jgi:hypothetical protein
MPRWDNSVSIRTRLTERETVRDRSGASDEPTDYRLNGALQRLMDRAALA